MRDAMLSRIERSVLIAFMVMTIHGTAADAEEIGSTQCWSTVIQSDVVRNFQLLCIGKTESTVLTFFANPGKEPTICRQQASPLTDEDGAVVVSSVLGKCDNDLPMGPTTYRCTQDNSQSMVCVVGESLQLVFRRESKDLYRDGSKQ